MTTKNKHWLQKKLLWKEPLPLVKVIIEVVYVLQDVYHLNKLIISDGLKGFIREIDIQDKPVIRNALDLFSQSNLDYVDCDHENRY